MSRKSRMRRQARGQQAVADDDDDILIVDAPEPEADVEAAAAPDPEPEGKEGAAEEDPIAVLKRNLERAESQKAEAETRYAAERKRAQELEAQTASHGAAKLAQDKIVLEQAYANADARAKEAQRAYASAAGEGRWDDAAEAQRAMARIESEMGRYGEAYQTILDREKTPPPQQKQQEFDFDAQVEQIPDANTRQWAKDHKDDLTDPARLQLAYAADRMAIARGLKPGSDAYLDYLDEQMGYEMEDADDDEAPAAPPPSPRKPAERRAPPIAAPVSRTGSGALSVRSVTLTETDKIIADQLGQTHKEYAKTKMAAQKSDRYNRYSNGRAR